MSNVKNLAFRFKVVVVLLFYAIGWFLFTYRILDVPPGINGDEAAVGYNAALVARTGRDSEDRLLPLFTKVADSNDWKQPTTFYSEVLAFRLFGPSYFNLKAVSVFFVLISGTLIFFLIKELLGLKSAILGLLIFATTPIVMIQSHLAMENIAPVPFIALWLWMLAKYTKKQELKYLILAATSLGIGLYSYLGLRLIVPVFALTSVVYIYYITGKKRVLSRTLIFIATLLPFFILLLLIKKQYPGAILGQYRPYHISSYQQLFLPYISSFDPSSLFIKGDSTPYHSTGKHGMFLLASLPLFILGLIKTINIRKPIFSFVLVVFFSTPLLFGLGSDIHRGSRLLALVPIYSVITSLGGLMLFSIKDRLWRFVVPTLIIVLIALNFLDFTFDYWYEYPKRVKSEFAKPIHIAFKNLNDESHKLNFTPLLQTGLEGQNPIAFKFFEEIYFQSRLKRWQTKDLPKSSVILADLAGIRENGLDERSFKSLDLDGLDYYLLINR